MIEELQLLLLFYSVFKDKDIFIYMVLSSVFFMDIGGTVMFIVLSS